MVMRLAVKAVQNPDHIMPYVRRRYRESRWRMIQNTVPRGTCVVGLDGYELGCDLSDNGLSKDVILDKTREPVSSNAYRRELARLGESTSGAVTVLEVGANIGYYALIPPADLDDVAVYAVEVDESNVEMLEKNVARNNYTNSFEVDCVAFGSENTDTELYRTDSSNCHSTQDTVSMQKPERVEETVTVPMRRGTDWLAESGVEPEEVDVLRMDVEGAEADVLRGMPDVLDTELLLHIEIHPVLMGDADVEYLCDRLAHVDIVCAARNDTKIHGVDSIGDAVEYDWIELVMWNRKGGGPR